MKVVVLGATGILGAYTSLGLKDEGHEVVAVGRRESDNGFFHDNGIRYIGGFRLEDVTCYGTIPNEYDAVVHLAGAMPAHADNEPMPYVQSIVAGMVNVLEWMRAGVARRIVFNTTPSDVAAFFGRPIPVPSDAPRSFPKDGGDHAIYAICKNAAVDILEHYRIAYGFKPLVFRHMTVYAWKPVMDYGLKRKRGIPMTTRLMRKCIAGGPVEIWGSPGNAKELLYIDDFVDAVKHGLETDTCGLFNLPGYKKYTLEDQIDGYIHGFAPSGKCDKVYCKGECSSPINLLDGAMTEAIFGWKARVPWPEACERMAKEARINRFEKLWGKSSKEDIPL